MGTPLSIRECRPAVQRFACKMEETLRKHDHKGGWDTCTPEYLFGKLVEETGELSEALLVNVQPGARPLYHRHSIETLEEIMAESLDVGSTSMMIFDNTLIEYLSRKHPGLGPVDSR